MGTGAVRAGGAARRRDARAAGRGQDRGHVQPGTPGSGSGGRTALFDERGLVEVNRSTTPAAPQTGAAAAGFTEGELIAMLPHATPTNVERLCAGGCIALPG